MTPLKCPVITPAGELPLSFRRGLGFYLQKSKACLCFSFFLVIRMVLDFEMLILVTNIDCVLHAVDLSSIIDMPTLFLHCGGDPLGASNQISLNFLSLAIRAVP